MKYNFTDGFSASSIDIDGMPYVGKVFDALMAQEVWFAPKVWLLKQLATMLK